MKRMIVLILMLLILVGCVQTPGTNQISFDDLERISFSDLDQMIEQKKSGLVYFGWVEGCGDAVNISIIIQIKACPLSKPIIIQHGYKN